MLGRRGRDYSGVTEKAADRFDKKPLVILFLLVFLCNPVFSYSDDFSQSFVEPPEDARPMTWWHWMDGNITKEGITADLEAMKKAGIGGALMFHVNQGLPLGPVRFGTPDFYEMVQFAIDECERLGLKFGVNNCDGWSSSGGPWVQTEDSMKVITDSQAFVTGPENIHMKFPGTFTNLGYSKDISVFAYPSTISEQENMYVLNPRVKVSGSLEGGLVVDGDAQTVLKLPKPSVDNPPIVEITFDEPFSANGFTFIPGGITDKASVYLPYDIELWISDDSKEYTKVGNVYRAEVQYPQTFDFKVVKAKHFQFRFIGVPAVEQVLIAEIRLHNGARLKEFRKLTYQNNSWVTELSLSKREMVPGDDVLIDAGKVIDITDKLDPKGFLDWQVPPGKWTIVRVAATTNARRNVPASREGHGLEVDKLSKGAVDRFWDGFLGKVIHNAGHHAGGALKFLEVDSWEVGFQNWTDSILDEFKSRRGYSPKAYLLALAGQIVNSKEETERFLWDYRTTINELAKENYIHHMAEKAESHGIVFYNEPYHGPFDCYEFGGSVHVPMGEFWDTKVWGNRMHTCKLAACIAHAYGQKIVSAEAFTTSPESAGWQNHPYSLKALGDEAFCKGINEMVFHRFTHQSYPNAVPGMTMGRWGAHIDRTQTWWKPAAKAWTTYLARCQYMLRQGRFVADIAYYTGQEHSNNSLGFAHLRLSEHQGYDYDMFSKEILLKATVEDGQLVLPSGMRYKILVLPKNNDYMTVDVANKIAELVEAGAIMVGPRPKASPSLSNYPADDEKIKSIADAVWGHCDGESVKQNRFGKGMVICGKSLNDVLPVRRDFDYKSNQKAEINYIHRTLNGDDLYFVANKESEPIETTCIFRVIDKTPEIWDPLTGQIGYAPVWRQMKDCIEVDITFPQRGSYFVLFRESPQARKHITKIEFNPLVPNENISGYMATPFSEGTTPGISAFTNGDLSISVSDGRNIRKSIGDLPSAIDLDSSWTVKFPQGWSAPSETKFENLISWTESADFNIKHFSGTATYEKQFTLPENLFKDGIDLWLDFGTVHEIAEILVNGRQYPVLWKPPFKLNATDSLKAGINCIEVKVTNLWPNRLIGDEYYPEDFEAVGPKGPLSKIPEWVIEGKSRPEQRRKTFVVYRHWTKDDPLFPSGLLGPVRVVPARVINLGEQFAVLTEPFTELKSDQSLPKD